MPRFSDINPGYFAGDPRVHTPPASCRHGYPRGDFGHDNAIACKESLLKGKPFWLRPYKRITLPPTFKLPYLGGLDPAPGSYLLLAALRFQRKERVT